MKKRVTLIFAAGALLLAGCTTSHATKWEYKVVQVPHLTANSVPADWREQTQNLLNNAGKEGWVLVSQADGRIFYFKRPLK